MVRASIVAAMLGVLPGCAHAQDASWLAGYWLSCSPGREVSETWSDARAGMMVGAAITLDDGKPSWEFSRIGPSAAGLSYFALPSGQEAAEFPLSKTKSSATRLVFENLAHDFPQRVIYTREGGKLSARIEGMIDGKFEAMDWSYVSASLNQRCPS
jgi:hypothetical protein